MDPQSLLSFGLYLNTLAAIRGEERGQRGESVCLCVCVWTVSNAEQCAGSAAVSDNQ